MIDSVLIFTTVGSTSLGTLENSDESWVGAGIAMALAADESAGRAASTDLLIAVPMTTPMANVARIKEKNKSFRLFIVSIILSKLYFILSLPLLPKLFLYYLEQKIFQS